LWSLPNHFHQLKLVADETSAKADDGVNHRLCDTANKELQMPNGKPGDHPFTDILHYGSSEFGEPVDALVKSMSKATGFDTVKNEVSDLLWNLSPMGKPAEKRQELISTAYEKLQHLNTKIQNQG
jgi:hypothetical protein